MEKYFCIFSEVGTVRTDFRFANTDDYFSFVLANKNTLLWAKLIDLHTGETIDEFTHTHSIDFSKIKVRIPEEFTENVQSLLLINKQQLVWLSKFACLETPDAFNRMEADPIYSYSIPAKSSLYEEYMPSGFALVSREDFNRIVSDIYEECTTNYKKRLFKMMVNTKGLEIVVNNVPLIE